MKNILVRPNGVLVFNGKGYRCALGKGGVKVDHVEGDEATPTGCFRIRKVFYRPDKFDGIPPETVFPTQALYLDDGWSDDVNLLEYNKHIKLPYDGSHEELWRKEDHLYDIIVVLGRNDSPPVPRKGSAIFMHLTREGYPPTHGCIALSREDLLEILRIAKLSTQVCVSL